MIEGTASANIYERAEHATRVIRARVNVEPRIAVVLGSELGGFADDFDEAVKIPYEDIPGFVRSTAQGHAGRLVIGKVDNVPVLAMQGRVHYYEGYSLEEVTFPVRTFKLLGIKTLILTNASGGINVQLTQGALMVISDHLNLMGDNPLRGPNDDRFGPRFPDMSSVYSPELQELVVEEARGIGVEVRRGIYGAVSGPSYETPADSTVRPRSAISRRSRRMKRISSGVSTKTFISICSSKRGSAKIMIPSTITIGLDSTARVSFKRECVLKS